MGAFYFRFLLSPCILSLVTYYMGQTVVSFLWAYRHIFHGTYGAYLWLVFTHYLSYEMIWVNMMTIVLLSKIDRSLKSYMNQYLFCLSNMSQTYPKWTCLFMYLAARNIKPEITLKKVSVFYFQEYYTQSATRRCCKCWVWCALPHKHNWCALPALACWRVAFSWFHLCHDCSSALKLKLHRSAHAFS